VTAAQLDVTVPPVTIALPAATVGQAYGSVFASPNVTLGDTQLDPASVAPPGLLLIDNPDGTFTLTGTPTVAGDNVVSLVERDAAGSVHTYLLALVVNAAP
jgi:hypothetical protein